MLHYNTVYDHGFFQPADRKLDILTGQKKWKLWPTRLKSSLQYAWKIWVYNSCTLYKCQLK